MTTPFTNITNRVPLAVNPTQVVNIFSINDLPPLTEAPDGVMRSHLTKSTLYIVHNQFVWPRLWFPPASFQTAYEVVEIRGVLLDLNILINGNLTEPHFSGRENSAIFFSSISVIDIGNAGAGQSTKLFDCVGGRRGSSLILQDCLFFRFGDMGRLVDMPIFLTGGVIFAHRKGLVIRTLSPLLVHSLSVAQHLSDVVPMVTPSISFQGEMDSLSMIGGNVSLLSGDNCYYFDENLLGDIDMGQIGYKGTPFGNLITDQIIASISSISDASISIDSFADSVDDPGLNTTVIFPALVRHNQVKGDYVLIANSTNYDGLHQIVSVSTNMFTFDIAVTHITSTGGTLERINIVTSGTNPLADGFSMEISGTGINADGFHFCQFPDDSGFVVPHTFTATDTGTITVTPKIKSTPSVNVLNCGAQASSLRIAVGDMNANVNTTAISDGSYSVVNVTGILSNVVTERFSLTNSTNGIFTYIDNRPFNGTIASTISALKSGSTGNYRFTASINGATPVFASAIYAPMEVKTTKVTVPFICPISLVENDTVQIMCAGDGTPDDPTITDITIQLS